MSRTQPFTRVATVVLDSSGNGSVATGPQLTNEQWTVSTAAVRASSHAKEARCSVYAGGNFADATTWGSTGDSTDSVPGPLYPGQTVAAIWTGGDPGAVATLIVNGTRTVP